jgi:DNA-binding NarL/FixJ family response regulator
LIVVDRDLRVVLASRGAGDDELDCDFIDLAAKRLQPSLERVVRDLLAVPSAERFAFVTPTSLLRVVPLEGDARRLIAITIEKWPHCDSLAHAARTYSLSPRQVEVLTLILQGASAPEIADTLSLAESTIQGYFKDLLCKTGARNRPAMVAKVLGWAELSEVSSRSSTIA